MGILSTISELTLVGVADRGVPNKERIVLRPTETVNLGAFALLVGWMTPEGDFYPLPDMFFWPGNIQIAPPSWLYVYTAPGIYSVSKITSTDQPVHVCHWGRKQVIFTDDRIQPALIRLGGIGFGGGGHTEAPMTEAEWSQLLEALAPPPKPPTPTVTLQPAPKMPTVTLPPSKTPGVIAPAPKSGEPPRPSIADMLKKKKKP